MKLKYEIKIKIPEDGIKIIQELEKLIEDIKAIKMFPYTIKEEKND